MARPYALKEDVETGTGIMATLARRRIDQGLTLQCLSRQSGYSTASICEWERGRKSPTLRVLEEIAQVLGARIVVAD